VITVLGAVSDSMTALASRTSRYQAGFAQDMYAMQQQLVTIQELTGQSQRRLQELRASMEQRAQELGTQAPATGAAGAAGAAPAAGSAPAATGPAVPAAGPGPNQLFQLALDQLRRGSTGSARSAFQDLLRQYPQSDVAGDAQFYIAESYATEGKAAEADSVYALVVANHGTSSRAATALYKRGVAAEAARRPADARAFYEGVVRQFPRSDEAALARDRLAALR
jgi:tol-pal system protein YbgF